MVNKKIPFFRRMSSKLIAISLLLIVLAQFIIYTAISRSTASVMQEILRKSLQEKVLIIATNIDLFFTQRIHDTRIISQADVFEANEIDPIIQYLTEINEETPFIDDIDIVSISGIVTASSGEQNEKGIPINIYHKGIDSLFNVATQAKQGDVFVSEARLLDNGPGVIIITPITDESNTTVIKVLLIEVSLKNISDMIKIFDTQISGNKHTYLVDNNGKIIVSGDSTTIFMQRLPDLNTNPNLLFRFSDQGYSGTHIYIDSKHHEVMAGFADMAEQGLNKAHDWSVIAIAPMSEISKPFSTLKDLLKGIMLTVMIFVMLAMVILSRSIIKAVTILISSAQKVTNGDLTHRVAYTTNNEFGYLAGTMNDMLNKLEQLQQENVQTNDTLLKEKELLKVTLHSIGDGVITTDIEGRIRSINQITEQLTGWKSEEAINKKLSEVFNIIHETTREPCDNHVDTVIETGSIIELPNHTILIDRSGVEHTISDSAAPIIDNKGSIIGVILVFRDVSEIIERKREKDRLQEMLNHKSKMDAIGQLAGGVAHDFNNMLGGIMGAATLLSSPKRNLDDKSKKFINIIMEAATRAADLTEKLMAFGRKGKLISTAINLHTIIDDTIAILQQSIDKAITMETFTNAENAIFIGDNTGIQNVIINMGINASHAMKEGGTLTIETRNITLTSDYCYHSSFTLEPGNYILMLIKDTGVGMSAETMDQIFDPFFTTKKHGEGTGLGLASAYGSIEGHHGAVEVYSEPGTGSTFHIYLPVSNKQVTPPFLTGNTSTDFPPSTRVLLIDDEPLIRITGTHILEDVNIEVLSFESGLLALEYFKKEHETIDLVITDMIMPEINGRDLFYKMHEIAPDCPVILSSGFTKDEDVNTMKEDGLAGFIRKPFRDHELIEILHSIIQSK